MRGQAEDSQIRPMFDQFSWTSNKVVRCERPITNNKEGVGTLEPKGLVLALSWGLYRLLIAKTYSYCFTQDSQPSVVAETGLLLRMISTPSTKPAPAVCTLRPCPAIALHIRLFSRLVRFLRRRCCKTRLTVVLNWPSRQSHRP
jgi:hypothetical protein